MSTTKIIYGCLFLLANLTAHTWACGKRDTQDDKPPVVGNNNPSTGSGSGSSSGTTINACCVCGQPIDITIVVSNQIQEPFFEFNTTVKGLPQRELIHHLEVASTQDKRFRFGAEHGTLGFLIAKLNDLSASSVNKTYWRISALATGSNSPRGLRQGVSYYIPTSDEIVMFNFTSYATPDNH